MKPYIFFTFCTLGLWSAQNADAHGRLMKPCQRGSLWRCYGRDRFKADYRDMGLFCGGKRTQWKRNEGKCGICGDAYDAQVKPHEAGGRYATRFITETYTQGQQIDVMVELTAPHKGKFFFKICKQTDESKEVTQECLNKTPLKVIDNGTYKDYYEVKATTWSKLPMKLQLPPDFTCDHCVFQWWYTAGNSWGQCPNKKYKLGCGPQETFVNCADIKILPSRGGVDTATQAPATVRPATAMPITQAPATNKPATARPATAQPATQAPITAKPIPGDNSWLTKSPSLPRTTPLPNTQTTTCNCTAPSVKNAICKVKTIYDDFLGPDFCAFLVKNGANLYHVNLFCDCN
uniref:Uncharacterized protein n=1 Tax=Magallana gigas TaxID=29159 RepID=K1R007_MAGGI|eukprot:XP_011452747.1 PREDICTED: uncharacterized protein LOC105345993 [Crassostrea gigas]